MHAGLRVGRGSWWGCCGLLRAVAVGPLLSSSIVWSDYSMWQLQGAMAPVARAPARAWWCINGKRVRDGRMRRAGSMRWGKGTEGAQALEPQGGNGRRLQQHWNRRRLQQQWNVHRHGHTPPAGVATETRWRNISAGAPGVLHNGGVLSQMVVPMHICKAAASDFCMRRICQSRTGTRNAEYCVGYHVAVEAWYIVTFPQLSRTTHPLGSLHHLSRNARRKLDPARAVFHASVRTPRHAIPATPATPPFATAAGSFHPGPLPRGRSRPGFFLALHCPGLMSCHVRRCRRTLPFTDPTWLAFTWRCGRMCKPSAARPRRGNGTPVRSSRLPRLARVAEKAALTPPGQTSTGGTRSVRQRCPSAW